MSVRHPLIYAVVALLALAAAAVVFLTVGALRQAVASYPPNIPPQQSGEMNRAAVVVDFGNGQTRQKCVEFPEEEISGLELLERSGLQLSVDPGNPIGVAVCKIGGEGCSYPNESCFCKCQGASCFVWSHWQRNGDEWAFADPAASKTNIRDGDMEGWAWGDGNSAQANPPPLRNFEQVCAIEPTATDVPPTETTPAETPDGTLTATATGTPPTETPTHTTTATATATVTTAPATATRTRTPSRTATTNLSRTPTNTRTASPTATTGLATSTLRATRFIPTSVQVRPPTRSEVVRRPTVSPPTAPPAENFVPTLRPTRISSRALRTPTRVAIAGSNAQTPNQSSDSVESNTADTRAVEIQIITGVLLTAGILIVGAGGVVVLGGLAYYLYRRGGL